MEGTADKELVIMGTTKGFTLKRLVKTKAVRLISIVLMMVLPAAFFGGCAVGQVVQPFSPKKVNPEPYTPEPVWNANTDPTLLAIQSLKRQTNQGTPPGSATPAATTTGGTTGGVTPVPGPTPGPPVPPARVWSPADPVWGYVLDRLSGLPVSTAVVTLTNSLGTVSQTYMTSGDGGFSFVDIPVGYYKIEAEHSAYNSIPLSFYNFYYSGAQVFHTLELLSTSMPTLVLTDQIDKVGPVGYAYRTQQYIASQQQTYNGVLFTAPSGIAAEFRTIPAVDDGQYNTFSAYWFSLPVPSAYGIGYDGYWVTSEQYGDVSGVWGALTQDKVERQFYDWDNFTGENWVSIDRDGMGIFDSSTTGYVPFWAIKRYTDINGPAGTVLMRLCPREALVFVASVSLKYDYHKLTSAPAIDNIQTYGTAPNNSTYLELNENVYINASGSAKWLPAYAGIAAIPWASHTFPIPTWYHFDVNPGSGSIITVVDQAGQSTAATVP